MGCVVYGVLNGLRESERIQMIVNHLAEQGLERFAQIETEPEHDVFRRHPPRID
jgi:hypothetical protein